MNFNYYFPLCLACYCASYTKTTTDMKFVCGERFSSRAKVSMEVKIYNILCHIISCLDINNFNTVVWKACDCFQIGWMNSRLFLIHMPCFPYENVLMIFFLFFFRFVLFFLKLFKLKCHLSFKWFIYWSCLGVLYGIRLKLNNFFWDIFKMSLFLKFSMIFFFVIEEVE